MIVDAHTHLFPPSICDRREDLVAQDATLEEMYRDPRARMATAEDLIQAMDEAGVQAAVAVGIGWNSRELAREANDYLLEAAHRFPGRVVPFCSVSPLWGDGALGEVERCAGLGARGIGELHPDTQGYRIDDIPLLTPLVETARQLGLALLVHASEPVGHAYPGKGYTHPGRLYPFLQAFPEVTAICAHWGGGLPFYALMPEVKEALGNVYFDTAASPLLYSPRIFSVALELLGPNRILMGSDFPLVHPRRIIGQVAEAPIPREAREAILGGNAARLFGLGVEG